MEEWAPALGFEEFYEVSDHGRARRIKTHYGRPICSPLRMGSRRGYGCYAFTVGNQKHYLSPHRLVWETFISTIPDGCQINHKNGDKRDNRLVNLEVCTPKENTGHAYTVLGRVRSPPPHKPRETNGRAKLREGDLPVIKQLRAEGWSQQRIADKFGVNQTVISGILRGVSWR